MEMTREQFKELFGLKEEDAGMEYADELHEDGECWWDIARGNIATMNMLLLRGEHER